MMQRYIISSVVQIELMVVIQHKYSIAYLLLLGLAFSNLALSVDYLAKNMAD